MLKRLSISKVNGRVPITGKEFNYGMKHLKTKRLARRIKFHRRPFIEGQQRKIFKDKTQFAQTCERNLNERLRVFKFLFILPTCDVWIRVKMQTLLQNH